MLMNNLIINLPPHHFRYLQQVSISGKCWQLLMIQIENDHLVSSPILKVNHWYVLFARISSIFERDKYFNVSQAYALAFTVHRTLQNFLLYIYLPANMLIVDPATACRHVVGDATNIARRIRKPLATCMEP
jgi:hypothetical protein